MLEIFVQRFTEHADIGHLALTLMGLSLYAAWQATFRELAEANRRFDAFVRELAAFNRTFGAGED